jgi:diguanylate cyclase (GGDEF)-like protein/PAS domain S-box-containing protein
MPRPGRNWFIWTAAFGYAVLAALWIVFSDRLLLLLGGDPEVMARYASVKGLGFVAVTAIALVIALRHAANRPVLTGLGPGRSRAWPLLAILFLAVVGLSATGLAVYRIGSESLKLEQFDELQAVANLKANALSRWLDERRANARGFGGNPAIATVLSRWVSAGTPRERLMATVTLSQIRSGYGFSGAQIVDADGDPHLVDGEATLEGAPLRDAIAMAESRPDPVLVDLYEPRTTAGPRLAFVAPIIRMGTRGTPASFIVLELSASDYLYPILAERPIENSTGETLLVRRDGDQVAFVSTLRYRPGSALKLRFPLSNRTLPEARLLSSAASHAEGWDYRGVRVLTAAAHVSGTPWMLVAKVDAAEAFARIRQLALITLLGTVGALAVAVVLTAAAWQRQQLQAALGEVAQRRETAAAERRFLATFDQAPVGIAHLDREGRWLRVNPRLADLTGYAPNDLLALDPRRMTDDDIDGLDAAMARLVEGKAGHWTVERVYLRPDGRAVRLDFTLTLVRDESGAPQFFTLAVADVTERARAAEEQRRAAAVFLNTHEGVVVTDPRGAIVAVNPAFCSITGYSEAELIGQNMRILQSGRQDESFYRTFWASIAADGFWQGEIWNRRKDGDIYPELLTVSTVRDENGAVRNYVGTFTDITRLKQSQAQLEHLARHDALTGLPNRLLLLSRLEHALERLKRHGGFGAVLFMDLDRFKTVNDSLGHPAGDELLKAVADRLRQRLRDSDTLARLGGDEFVAVLEDLGDVAQAGTIAQMMIERISAPFHIAGHEVYVGLSVGISLFPLDAREAQSLIQEADTALYAAKEGGRGTYRFYRTELTEAASTRLATEARLRRALEHGDMVLHYQPLISIAEERLVGVEALVRWQDPAEGLIPPGRFIGFAEETGLIVPLGDWVLGEACRQTQAWRAAGLDIASVAVNLSSRQFELPDIAERVQKTLAETGLPPECLELEITESALMHHGDETLGKLAALKSLGVRLSVDDFGTGYSSLAYLKRFPIDKLKIDKSFVEHIAEGKADMQITAVIIDLARNLGLEALAEGVETPAQLDFLRQRGCDTAQGYLFARPLPAEELAARIADSAWLRGAGRPPRVSAKPARRSRAAASAG